MRITLAAGVAAASLVLVACGSDGATTATDPSSARPTEVPAAPGPVDTRGLVTVMDTGTPELCLGPVAESWPPQCSGPEIDGWDWADHGGVFEHQGDIRRGSFAVSGTWDGTTFGYESAVPGALYDPMVEPSTPYPEPSVEHSPAELQDIAEEVGDLPGAQGAYADGGRVLVDVVYDDGSLQDWVDETYGVGVVVVSSMLVNR